MEKSNNNYFIFLLKITGYIENRKEEGKNAGGIMNVSVCLIRFNLLSCIAIDGNIYHWLILTTRFVNEISWFSNLLVLVYVGVCVCVGGILLGALIALFLFKVKNSYLCLNMYVGMFVGA